jgi:hypothetical protein
MLMVSPIALRTTTELRIARGNGNGDDHGAAPTAQKEQDHDCGQADSDDRFANDAVNGSADED